MCLLVICICSLIKCLYISFAHFVNGFFILMLSFGSSLCIIDTISLLDMWLVCKYVLPVCLSFCPHNRVFCKAKFLILMRSNLLFFHTWIFFIHGVKSSSSLLSLGTQRFSLLLFYPLQFGS